MKWELLFILSVCFVYTAVNAATVKQACTWSCSSTTCNATCTPVCFPTCWVNCTNDTTPNCDPVEYVYACNTSNVAIPIDQCPACDLVVTAPSCAAGSGTCTSHCTNDCSWVCKAKNCGIPRCHWTCDAAECACDPTEENNFCNGSKRNVADLLFSFGMVVLIINLLEFFTL